mmetsp:Transcript_63205/g.203736  ORF Transcript_63205/g.203736 Transcript_63205/m.203736 type:complete len:217 (-) Transcript_63205:736-1386(-)
MAEADGVAVRKGPVRRWHAEEVRAEFRHQAPFRLVVSEPTCGEDDRVAKQRLLHARLVHVRDALDFLALRVLYQASHRAAVLHLDSRDALHRGACVLHDGETHGHWRPVAARRDAVRALPRMAAELREHREVHADVVDEPVDGLRALPGEHRDAADVAPPADRAHVRVPLEVPPVVLDAVLVLHSRAARVDAACGLRGVASASGLLLEECDLGAGL